jgi:hypothetical protein
MGYKEDMATALKRQSDLISKQVMLEVIQVVSNCETYDEFRKAMYGMALNYLKEMESDGTIRSGTLDKVLSGTTKEGSMPDDSFLI